VLYYKRTKGDDQHQKGIDTMKNTDKMTNAKALAFILENVEGLPSEITEKLEAMKASIEKKSANRKPTAVQVANIGLMEEIYEAMKPNTLYQCKDITKLCDISSTQRTSALMRKMVDSGKVEKVVDKSTTYFQKVID
jgi:hypothetical protein